MAAAFALVVVAGCCSGLGPERGNGVDRKHTRLMERCVRRLAMHARSVCEVESACATSLDRELCMRQVFYTGSLNCHMRGAPPIVASGSRSMLYRCCEMYMIGTPGICMHSARGRNKNDVRTWWGWANQVAGARNMPLARCETMCLRAMLKRAAPGSRNPQTRTFPETQNTHLADAAPQILVACSHNVALVRAHALTQAVVRIRALVCAGDALDAGVLCDVRCVCLHVTSVRALMCV